MGYSFRVFETVKSKVSDYSQVPIKPGQYLICTDSGDLFYDTGDGVRKHLTDVIDLETEAQRKAILAPLDKTYFVKESGIFWRYINNVWVSASATGGSEAVYGTLAAKGWSGGQQTIKADGVTSERNGIISVTQDISAVAMEAARNGQLYVCGQAAGQITVAADGEIPACDIPVVIILWN